MEKIRIETRSIPEVISFGEDEEKTYESNIAKLFIISDIHIGSVGFNKKAFEETLDRIAMEQPTHVIINGDMIDGITSADRKRFDPMSIHEDFSDMKSMGQIVKKECDVFIEYMQSIKNFGIELIIFEGNHESAFTKYYPGFDPYLYICEELDAIHGKQCAFIETTFGDQTYVLYGQHGSGGGGTTEGYHLNKIAKLARTIDCDLYFIGHIHKMGTQRVDTLSINGIHSKWVAVSGCYLDTFTDEGRMYFSNKATSLSSIGYLVVELRKDKHILNVRTEYL